MTTIKVAGKKDGKKEDVSIEIYADGEVEYKFNGKGNPLKEIEFSEILNERHPIGGTYFPERGTALYFLAAVHYYLDRVDSEEVDGADDEEMPYEEGVIY